MGVKLHRRARGVRSSGMSTVVDKGSMVPLVAAMDVKRFERGGVVVSFPCN